MAQIRITPQELRDGATFLGERKSQIVDEVGSIISKIDEIANNWEGAAQSAFLEAFETMKPILKEQFPEVVEGIMSQLNGAAEAIEQTDLEVSKAFKG